MFRDNYGKQKYEKCMYTIFKTRKKCIMQEKSLFVLNIITVIFGTVNNILAILLPKYLLATLNYSDLKLFVLYLAVFLGVRFW